MKKLILFFVVGILAFFAGWKLNDYLREKPEILETIVPKNEKVLEKYTIDNLSRIDVEPGTIEPSMKLAETDEYVSYYINFLFRPDLVSTKSVTGQMNLPSGKDGPFPLIIMLRGYINQETYKTGDGTRNAAKYFAENGFITIAPDFLGYGGSDEEAENIFETRFQTYTTVVALLNSLESLSINWDRKNIFLWGHSNGGQIALTVLEVTGKDYPTALWAPVSEPFPYSVLYYTDESEDRGKLIRKELALFEENYNPDLYSLDLFLDKIQAPVQIHQGTNDDAVPYKWNDNLVAKLKELEKEVDYYKYQGMDHNMRPEWDTVIERDLEFFKSHLKPSGN